jgi:hypothetical protein
MLVRSLHSGDRIEFVDTRTGEVIAAALVMRTQKGRAVLGMEAPDHVLIRRVAAVQQDGEKGKE